MLRTGNKYLAALTLLLDALKGYLPVIIAIKFFPQYVLLSALLTFLGHVFSIWLKFKGGKGIATYIGFVFAVNYVLGVFFVFLWLFIPKVRI